MTEPSRPCRISRRDLWIATAYAAAAAILWGLQTVLGDLSAPPLGLPRPLVLLLLLCASAGIALRRRRPGAMFALTGGFGLAAVLLNGGLAPAIVLFEAVYSAVLHGSRRLAGAVALLCAGLTLAVVLAAVVVVDLRPAALVLVVQALLILVLPMLWASEVRRHREAATQAERTVAAERELAARHLELEHARAALRLQEQRTHLAQELHDGVTGHLSAVALQTGALRSSSALRQDPAALDRSLEAVRTSALEALTDMRRLIDVLRADSPDLAETSTADRDSWDSLAARLRALRPGSTIEISPAAIDRVEAVGISAQALRIGQEAVTNLLKHAGPEPVSLRLAGGDGEPVVLTVDSPLSSDGTSSPDDGAGLGLPSMRRRAEETGADLEVGPIDATTWRVRSEWAAQSSSVTRPEPDPRQLAEASPRQLHQARRLHQERTP